MRTFIRNFRFKEKEEVNQLYPQYYHKTDKVCSFLLCSLGSIHPLPVGVLLLECFPSLSASTDAPSSPPESSHSNAAGEA